jgi:ABC-2 type transport system ATP-binding protein
MEENTDIRETLFYRFAEQKCPILEMKLKKASLEEIFLELTENEKEDAKELEDSKKGKKEEFVDPEDISDEEETSSDLEEKQEEVEE